MSTTTIGIKVADRTYYPVLARGSASRKKLILTTVKDEQTSVQIDLYENTGTVMDTAQYVGSLLIENIDPAQSGEAEVELIVGLDANQTLGASATEGTSGERQSLSVSLEALSDDSVYDIPEFELEDDLDSWDTSETDASESIDYSAGNLDLDDSFDTVGVEEQEAIVQKKRPVMFGLFIVLGVAAVVLIVLLLIKIIDGPKVPPLEARGNTATVVDNATSVGSGDSSDATVAGGGPSSMTAKTDDSTSSVSAYVPPKDDVDLGGTWYWIRRGDTLWGLSSAFYRNPWLYREIASQNNILDPDVIYAGNRIYIPPR